MYAVATAMFFFIDVSLSMSGSAAGSISYNLLTKFYQKLEILPAMYASST